MSFITRYFQQWIGVFLSKLGEEVEPFIDDFSLPQHAASSVPCGPT